MSAKVIEILKSKMSLKERQQFVANCNEQNPGWEKKIDGRRLAIYSEPRGLFNSNISFNWYMSKQGYIYWEKIYDRFTQEELSTKINLSE